MAGSRKPTFVMIFTNKFQVKMSFIVLLALEYSNFSTVVLAGLPGENSPVY